MNKVILDNSVIVKWYLQDEESSDQAFKIFQDLIDKKIILSEPYLIYYEFNNVINIAVKRGRIDIKDAINAIELFNSLPIIKYDFLDEHYKNIFKNAVDLGISSYDSSYISLAKEINTPFFTVDKDLITKCKSFSNNVRHINEY
jgi:predicted nucleic acid-binding protein